MWNWHSSSIWLAALPTLWHMRILESLSLQRLRWMRWDLFSINPSSMPRRSGTNCYLKVKLAETPRFDLDIGYGPHPLFVYGNVSALSASLLQWGDAFLASTVVAIRTAQRVCFPVSDGKIPDSVYWSTLRDHHEWLRKLHPSPTSQNSVIPKSLDIAFDILPV